MSNISVRRFAPGDVEPVRAIIERAASDGELTGFHAADVRGWLQAVPDDGPKTWVAELGGEVIGFLAVGSDAIIVSPEHRRKGAGRALVAAAVEAHPELELSQWSGSPETAAFLESAGFHLDHHLLRLVRTDTTLPPEIESPAGFELVHYRHEAFHEYVALIQESFSDHPTPFHLDEARIRMVHERPEFNPRNIGLIAIDGDARRPVGLVRLRVGEPENGSRHGAIALLGVHPDYRGRGFARQLIRWGIRNLIEQGFDEIELEVVTGNDRALSLYTSEGFEPVQSWPYWVPNRIHSS